MKFAIVLITIISLMSASISWATFIHTPTNEMNLKQSESLYLIQTLIELIGNPEFMALSLHEKRRVIRGFQLLIENYVAKLHKLKESKKYLSQQNKRFKGQMTRFYNERSLKKED
jgi:hypothetical protein